MDVHASGGPENGGAGTLKLENKLEASKSPYVRAHKDNPVAWQVWDDDTLALARKHNRLIFLSIGYAACHWCHVMERESFQSPEIATLLNDSFIPIKLDREERPDIDSIYMNYVQATTGSGGWPLSVFLTPDSLQPVFGGTYFPGPGSQVAANTIGESVTFGDVLEKMRDFWRDQESKCRESASEMAKQLRDFAEEGVHSGKAGIESGRATPKAGVRESKALKELGAGSDGNLDLDLLEEAYRTLLHAYDSVNGGLSAAPKFPVPGKLRYLLQLGQWPAPTKGVASPVRDILGTEACVSAAEMALATLRKMARGGIRDHIGYGFARYSVTADWSLPHFEKMLSDQALLLEAYLDAFLISHDAEMLGVIYDIATYLTTAPIMREGGGFYTSEDADSSPSKNDKEKREGAYYVWTVKTINSILDGRHADVFARFYGAKEDGNVPQEYDPHDDFLDQNVLSVVSSAQALSKDVGIAESEIVTILKEARQKLRNYRERERPRPQLDDKIVVEWNGLTIGALARAAAAISSIAPEAAKAWLDAAQQAAAFIRREMWDEETQTLWRVWREGRGAVRGLADDYANLAHGLLELWHATFDAEHLRWADALTAALVRDFWSDEGGGGFYTAPRARGGEAGDLLLRLKSGMDGAEPSANAVAAANCCRLADLLDDEAYRKRARQTLAAFENEIEHWPGSFPGLLASVAWLGSGSRCVWVIGGGKDSGAAVEKNGEAKDAFTAANVVRKLREQTGVGQTVLRIKGGEDDAFLKSRNKLVEALDVKEGEFRVMVCEKGKCRDAVSFADLE